MTPLRFRNRFGMALLPPGQEPEVWPGELDGGAWFTPRSAREAWARQDVVLAPPVLLLLEAWGEADAAGARARLSGFDDAHFVARLPRVRFAPGVVVASLRTPTLSPATTTNTLIVGAERLVVVDPATPDEDQQILLEGLIDGLEAEGRRVVAVALTHEHPDHVGAAARIAGRYRVPIQAHPITLARLAGGPPPESRPLEDGASLSLGAGWDLVALHTPGHAPGHLCFHESRYGSLVAGDMLSTISTIVIDPDLGGDMGAYLASLRRLQTLAVRTLYPAHGPASPVAARLLAGYLEHRALRERLFLEALAPGPRSLEEVLPEVYADTPALVHPVAAKSLRALAAWCLARGEVRREGDRWGRVR